MTNKIILNYNIKIILARIKVKKFEYIYKI